MKQFDLIVVDVGNTRCKVGLVQAGQLIQTWSIPLEECDSKPWRHPDVSRLRSSRLPWLLSGSNPPVIWAMADWLAKGKQSCRVIDAATPLPIRLRVDKPEQVGRDRLLNALGADARPAVIVSAGSAVTVNLVDSHGDFLGGAIFPSLRLMVRALHDHTASLPLVDTLADPPELPGKTTEQAIHAGVVQAVVGGVVGCVNAMRPLLGTGDAPVFLTGGDAPLLLPRLPWPVEHRPDLALQGLIIAFRTLGP